MSFITPSSSDPFTADELADTCLNLPGVTTDFPFDEFTQVFRVGGKIFALFTPSSLPLRINLKCEPALARDLRASYPEITPGWHMNKEHWNTVRLDGTLEKSFVEGMIVHSYERVRDSLPKSKRDPAKPKKQHGIELR